jgi:hypothetical protein
VRGFFSTYLLYRHTPTSRLRCFLPCRYSRILDYVPAVINFGLPVATTPTRLRITPTWKLHPSNFSESCEVIGQLFGEARSIPSLCLAFPLVHGPLKRLGHGVYNFCSCLIFNTLSCLEMLSDFPILDLCLLQITLVDTLSRLLWLRRRPSTLLQSLVSCFWFLVLSLWSLALVSPSAQFVALACNGRPKWRFVPRFCRITFPLCHRRGSR